MFFSLEEFFNFSKTLTFLFRSWLETRKKDDKLYFGVLMNFSLKLWWEEKVMNLKLY